MVNRVLGSADARSLRHGGTSKEGTPGLQISNEAEQKQQPRKRKRRSRAEMELARALAHSSAKSSYKSPYGPSSDTAARAEAYAVAGLSLLSPQTNSPDEESLLQAQIADDESSALLEYVQKKGRKHSNREHFSNSAQQPDVQAVAEATWRNVTVHSGYNTGLSHALPVMATPAPPDGAVRDPPVSLIDSLPRAKQQQIYKLLSGIQGGIDHLQKQLTLLQSSLGIDIEDRNDVS